MDPLEIELQQVPDAPDDEPDYFVAVKYENFIQGREDRVRKS
jgi:hypothetical protein